MTDENSSRNGSYEVINPPNKLKAKVGTGRGIDPKLLERAQSLVDGMSGEFEARAAEEATHILRLIDMSQAATPETSDVDSDDPEDDGTDDHIIQIFRIGHELKGQGGTFGYPLISKIGESLCRYIESVPDKDGVDLEVLCAHAKALRAVAANKVSGDGGPVEQEILGSLDVLVKQATN